MASVGDISSSLVTKTCSVLETYDETVRANQVFGLIGRRVITGFCLAPGIVIYDNRYCSPSYLGFSFQPRPCSRSPRFSFFQLSKQEGCRNLFRGPFCHYLSALLTMLTVKNASLLEPKNGYCGLFWCLGKLSFYCPLTGPSGFPLFVEVPSCRLAANKTGRYIPSFRH